MADAKWIKIAVDIDNGVTLCKKCHLKIMEVSK